MFLITSKGWINQKMGLDVTNIAYGLFAILSALNIPQIMNYLKYLLLNHFKILDTYIYISLFLYFLFKQEIQLQALSFLGIYIMFSSLSYTHNEKKYYDEALQGFILLSFCTLVGVYFGVAEYFLFESEYFYAVKALDYPSAISALPIHASGLQYSYNLTAYILMAALGILRLVNISSELRSVLVPIYLIALLLTQAKIVFLFIVLLITLELSKLCSNFIKGSLAFMACLGYLFFSHFLILSTNIEIESDKYYQELIFSFHGYEGYLSLFSWLKLETWNYLVSNNFLNISINDYQSVMLGYEPHFFLGSCILFGGLIFGFMISLRVLNNCCINFLLAMRANDIFFCSLSIVFLIESILWDAYDSPIFWIIVCLPTIYKKWLSMDQSEIINN